MDSGLNGKHVLITGASGGIGQSCAKLFDNEGTNLSLHYHKNIKSIKKLSSGLRGDNDYFQANLIDEKSVCDLFNSCIDKFGRIDHLIVNHGIWPEKYTPVHEMKAEQWEKTIAINLRAAFFCSKYFILNLENFPSDYGSIIYIGSTAGVFGEAGHVDYSVSKAGLYGMMLSLKNEIIHVARYGRINIVAPGWTITPMTEKFMDDHKGITNALQTIPLRKIARPLDIASIIVFLCSEKLAGHISGQLITVAGGMEGRKIFEPEEINIDQI